MNYTERYTLLYHAHCICEAASCQKIRSNPVPIAMLCEIIIIGYLNARRNTLKMESFESRYLMVRRDGVSRGNENEERSK